MAALSRTLRGSLGLSPKGARPPHPIVNVAMLGAEAAAAPL
eukprot:CAMPEP_0179105292 /NCGR_PEP_ID=MMETSP0796-20121207/48895_1 /TAXON_ID=73915 /ORGANISM="Pyrodinium bahamense, Strain pbaha01" /LENGTH=40 /DNA_ID= /DNA_START= /DNA_END= /DNA_ORIENTATION=